MIKQPWPDCIHMLRLQMQHGADARTVRNVMEALPRIQPETEEEHEVLHDWLARFLEMVEVAE